MKNILDLSQLIEDNMPVHPYDGQVRVIQDKYLDKDKYNNTRLEAGMHSGTHVDAPRHFLNCDKHISDFSLDRFIGNGCLLDVRGEQVISLKDHYYDLVKENDIVLLYTGYGKLFNKPEYYQSFHETPTVDTKLANFFIEKKIKMVGVDMATPDHFPFDIHKMLLSEGIFIMENLTNLDKLVDVSKFEVIALPLKITAESSVVRAIARW